MPSETVMWSGLAYFVTALTALVASFFVIDLSPSLYEPASYPIPLVALWKTAYSIPTPTPAAFPGGNVFSGTPTTTIIFPEETFSNFSTPPTWHQEVPPPAAGPSFASLLRRLFITIWDALGTILLAVFLHINEFIMKNPVIEHLEQRLRDHDDQVDIWQNEAEASDQRLEIWRREAEDHMALLRYEVAETNRQLDQLRQETKVQLDARKEEADAKDEENQSLQNKIRQQDKQIADLIVELDARRVPPLAPPASPSPPPPPPPPPPPQQLPLPPPQHALPPRPPPPANNLPPRPPPPFVPLRPTAAPFDPAHNIDVHQRQMQNQNQGQYQGPNQWPYQPSQWPNQWQNYRRF